MPDPQGPVLSRYRPIDHETVAVPVSAVGLNTIKASPAILAEITCETDFIRYRKDGGVPSGANGFLARPGERFYLWKSEVQNFQAIRTAGPATIQVQYYGPSVGIRHTGEGR
jgi:hypothetical protein